MLTIGENFLHYKVLSAIGSGGMGEVFLAKDNTLERKVAIKVLRKKFGKNEDGLERFVREAKAASALNHPNIITIYEIGESDGLNYIAGEYIDGKTLHQRIKSRDLSMREILDITIQTGEAMAAAHAAGIIHRDIKPENIMVRKDGYVKVLDFGLAKLTEHEVFAADFDAVTHKLVQTNPGVVMGTVSYMSPEQTRAREIDPRSDIWSLGVVLYEMISGQLPFTGDSTSDVIAAILTSTPRELSQHSPHVPKELDNIVRKALRKNREERYQDITDMVLDLRLLRGDLVSDGRDHLISRPVETARFAVTTQDDGQHRSTGLAQGMRLTWYLFPMLAIAGFVVAFVAWRSTRDLNATEPQQLTSMQAAAWKTDVSEGDPGRARLSPDGKLIAYSASKDGKPAIWLKQLDGGEPFTQRQANSSDTNPVWSPDTARLAFISDRGGRPGVWSAPALGGEPQFLAALDSHADLIRWSRDEGSIYFEKDQNLHALNVLTGEVTKLTDFDTSRNFDRNMSITADEKRIAFVEWQGEQSDIWIADLDGENRAQITHDAAEDGTPIWHPDGRRVIYNSERNGINQICVVDVETKEQSQLSVNDTDSYVSDISDDGSRIAYLTEKDDADLWGIPVAGGKEFQITSDLGVEFWPEVSPNGESVVYQSIRGPSTGGQLLSSLISSKNLKENRTTSLAGNGFHARWSPDGKSVAFLRDEAGNNRLWVGTAGGGGAARPVSGDGVMFGGYTLLPYNRLHAQDYQWSSDSSSLVYTAVRDGVSNVWQAFIDGSAEKQLTNNTDKNLLFFHPLFSPDGETIVWSGMTTEDELRKRKWSIWQLSEANVSRSIEADTITRLIGWSSEGRLLFRSIDSKSEAVALPMNVAIHELDLKTGVRKTLAKLKSAYFQGISSDGRNVAFVTRRPSGDSLETMSISNPIAKTLVEGTDNRVYFSNPVFAPDGNNLYFTKQANWKVISIVNNFK